MRLYVLGSKKLGMINVNDKTESSVSVSFKYNNQIEFPINLEKENNNWHLIKNDVLSIEKDGLLHNKIALEYYKTYFLNIVNVKGKIVAIPLPSFEVNFYDLSYSGLSEFTLGNDANAHIYYNNPLIQEKHAIFKCENNDWYIEAINNSLVYVNSTLIQKTKLKTGDIIFINGIMIIWNNNFMRINKLSNMQLKGFKVYTADGDNQKYEAENDLLNVELFNEEDYYSPKLVINPKLTKEKLTITPPPPSNKTEELPFILTLGSSITMLGSSFMMTYMVIYNLSSGTKSIALMIPQIVMCGTMIIGSLLMPRMISRYNKKKNEKNEKTRITKYTEYLEEKKKKVTEIILNQQQVLKENYPSCEECITFIQNNKISNIKFWSRNIKDDDFITVRLGNGDIPSSLELLLPEKDFSLKNDDLEDKMYEIGNNSKILHNVPITLSLKDNNKTGIMLKTPNKYEYINNLLLQLITLHNPYDLKIVIFTDKESETYFKEFKYIPHLWSDDKQIRFYATKVEEVQKISEYLVNEYKNRKENGKNIIDNSLEVEAEEESYQKDEAYKKYQPYYILIDDNYGISKNSAIVNLLNKTAVNFGFTYLGIGEQLKDFPNDCETFIEVNEKSGNILKKESNNQDIITFNSEYLLNVDIRKIINEIANVPILIKDQESSLPQSLQFLEMLDVSRIEQLNILNRWKTNNPITSLEAIVGVHSNGEKFKLDLHEKSHGPHGLIAGMTGSGKSEFIITYILSMIINYHPYEVQFVLIDYKGGGIAGAFENKEKGYKIPHLVGTITNLDTAEMNRTLVSIQSECKRRQVIFNEVKEKLGESTIDIYKYQRLYREGSIDEPMAHLFIICDEFAELKAQQPEFMNQLISVARIGRSLGIHLILATQKPTGVVNDQIWSNSKFKVCLKVQDRSDSMEVLKKPDAASIKEIGRFYLQVGYDDYFDIGQSGWSGAKYIPSDYIVKKIDDSISFVGNVGDMIKTIKTIIKVDDSLNIGDQLTNIVKNICDVSNSENIKTNKLWLDNIPENIYIGNLKQKYGYKQIPYYINPVIGEYDDPNNQRQGLLNLDLVDNNTLIYGTTGSGKEQLLGTIITSIALEHSPSEVNIYIMDFGSGSLKIYNSYPHVGDVTTIDELEKIQDNFSMIYDIIEERRKLFADYSGSYFDYIKNSGNKLPLITIVINNYDIFAENYSRLSENIINLYRDASKYGIIFVISVISPNAIRGRIAQYFNNKICLELPDVNEYRNILNSPRGLVPSNYYGRGLIRLNDDVVEFQTATLTTKDKLNETIRMIGNKMREGYSVNAKSIPTIPSIIDVKDFDGVKVMPNKVPVGYALDSKKPITFDLSKTPFNLIITENMTVERMSFVYAYIHMLTKIENTKVRIVDFIDVFEKNPDNLLIYKDDWEQTIIKLHNDIINGEKEDINYIYVFLGIGQVSKILEARTLEIFNKVLTSVNKNFKSRFVLVDVYNSIKNLGTEIWYQSCVDNSYGIWLGENVGTQLAINISNLNMDDRKLNFPYIAFIVENGKYDVIKHMVECEELENEE